MDGKIWKPAIVLLVGLHFPPHFDFGISKKNQVTLKPYKMAKKMHPNYEYWKKMVRLNDFNFHSYFFPDRRTLKILEM